MISKGTYTVNGASLNVTVIKVMYGSPTKIVAKLAFHYKNGSVCEIKKYKLKPEQIKHWRKVCQN